MRKRWLLAGSGALIAAAGCVIALVGSRPPSSTAPGQPATTAAVEKGNLSDMVSQYGTLTYQANSDGSPYAAINHARGTYTKLPAVGDEVACGNELYRVDDNPVLLLCGAVPMYRDLYSGEVGNDVRQLNANLHDIGDDNAAGGAIDPNDNAFTWKTTKALEVLQQNKGLSVTGELPFGTAVFMPESLRISKVIVQTGGSAQPGSEVLDATSDTRRSS